MDGGMQKQLRHGVVHLTTSCSSAFKGGGLDGAIGGSSLQLTPQLHLLVPEAMWREDATAVETDTDKAGKGGFSARAGRVRGGQARVPSE